MGGPKPGAPTGAPPRATPTQPSTSVSAQSSSQKPASKSFAVGGGSAQLEAQISELKLQNDTLDKERDFYFGKLRDIEVLLQARNAESSQNQIAQDILKILYASEDEKVQVSSDGKLIITGAAGEPMEVVEA